MIQGWTLRNGLGTTVGSFTTGTVDTPRSLPNAFLDIDALLADLGIEGATPAQKAQLKQLGKTLNKLMSVMNQIPSKGIRNMLMRMVDDIVSLAKLGDLTGANNMATGAVVLAENCLELCRRIQGNITTLKNPIGVSGPAKNLLTQIALAAQGAMNSADSLNALTQINDYTHEAVEIAGKLRGLDPKSKEYRQAMGDLGSILINLGEMAKDDGGDVILAGAGVQKSIQDGVDALRAGNTDVFQAQKLDHLERLMLQGAQDGGPMATTEAAREQRNGILTLAAGGKLDEALAQAGQMALVQGQMGKLHAHFEKQLERLDALGAKLNGPTAEMLKRTLANAREAMENAKTPEEMLKIDTALVKILAAADALAAMPQGTSSLIRTPAYAGLLAGGREIDALLPHGSRSGPPGFGTDDFATGKPRKVRPAPGTQPIGQQGASTAPVTLFGGTAPLTPPRSGIASTPVLAPSAAISPDFRRKAEKLIADLETLSSHIEGDAGAKLATVAVQCRRALTRCTDVIDAALIALSLDTAKRLATNLKDNQVGVERHAELKTELDALLASTYVQSA